VRIGVVRSGRRCTGFSQDAARCLIGMAAGKCRWPPL